MAKKTGSKTKSKWVNKLARKEGGKSQSKVGDISQLKKIEELEMAKQVARQVKKSGGFTSALRSLAFRSMKARVTKLAKKLLKR